MKKEMIDKERLLEIQQANYEILKKLEKEADLKITEYEILLLRTKWAKTQEIKEQIRKTFNSNTDQTSFRV